MISFTDTRYNFRLYSRQPPIMCELYLVYPQIQQCSFTLVKAAFTLVSYFLQRYATQRYMLQPAVSVCPSVCLSHTSTISKRPHALEPHDSLGTA